MDPTEQIALAPWAVELNFGAIASPDAPLPVAEVIPPPNADGIVEGRDGRRFRIKDMAALAARIGAQAVAPRIDFDHRSERGSPTFTGSTAAEGWIRAPKLNARGGIDAELELSGWAKESIRSRIYRYLSPALLHTADMELAGLSSVALVNDPNFHLPAPTVHNRSPAMDPTDADAVERDRALTAREKAADERALGAAKRAVDQAVTDGKIDAAAKDYHLAAIESHKDGMEAGLNGFDAMVAASIVDEAGKDAGLDAGALSALQTRVGPAGAPNAAAGGGAQPAFPAPAGVLPPDGQRLSLHQKIAEYARTNGVSYRDAVTHFGAMGH